jgi:HEAT repeat protein
LKTGISRTLSRVKDNLRATFDTNDQVIDDYVTVPAEVIAGLDALLKQPSNAFESRANAARALGVLRAQTTVPDLLQALYSKNDQLMFESLVALQKIRDPEAGPKLAFLVRDIAEPVQIAALHTVGILRTREALADTRYLLKNTKNKLVEREALTALSRIADPADHAEFLTYLASKDSTSRTLGAEGLARIHAPADLPAVTKAFTDEKDTSARLAEAFAMVAMGRLETNQLAPLGYVISMLNRTTFRIVAISYLTELTREAPVRQAIYGTLAKAARYEKTGIAIALSRSGEQDSVTYLQAMQNDKDPEVAQQGSLSLRGLQARLQ